jgi:hypothetical protein
MNLVFNASVGEVLFTPVCLTLLQYIAKIGKGIRKSFASLPLDLPLFRTTLISRSSSSSRVELLSDLFLLVRIIWLLKMDIKRRDW